jgi:hypothetical protein
VTTTNEEGILLLTSSLFLLTQTKKKDSSAYMTKLIQQLNESSQKLFGPLTKVTNMHKCTTKPDPVFVPLKSKKEKDE